MQRFLITSPSNPTIKDLVRLKDRKGEWSDKSFLVEGRRELLRALLSGFELQQLFICRDLAHTTSSELIFEDSVRVTELSHAAFAKVAMREDSDGILGVLRISSMSLKEIEAKISDKDALILAVEDVEKPGNLGAILRTADAAGADAVFVLGKTVDPWNQHVIRASLGGVFSVPVVSLTGNEFTAWCSTNKIATFAAALHQSAKSLYASDFKQPCAIIFGTEAQGLSSELVASATHVIQIPMSGVCDSLNVSVAAAVCIYEAIRQRTAAFG